MVPVYVSAALSFGLLFLIVVNKGLTQPQGKDAPLFSWVDKA